MARRDSPTSEPAITLQEEFANSHGESAPCRPIELALSRMAMQKVADATIQLGETHAPL
jgi:hypothetical protein